MSALVSAWRAIRRDETAREALDAATRARRQATVLAAVSAIVPTILATQGMSSLALDLLRFPLVFAVGLACFLELALVASALLARAAAMAGRPGGADAVAVWVMSATSGVLSALHQLIATAPDGSTSWTTEPGDALGAAVRFVAPLVAAWQWERVLRAARAEQAERTLAEVRRDRRYLAVGRVALKLRRLVERGEADSGRGRRSARRLDRAHFAALRAVPPGPTLADVLAAVGKVDELPAATITSPPPCRPTLTMTGHVRAAAAEQRPATVTAQVDEDDAPEPELTPVVAPEATPEPERAPEHVATSVPPASSGARRRRSPISEEDRTRAWAMSDAQVSQAAICAELGLSKGALWRLLQQRPAHSTTVTA